MDLGISEEIHSLGNLGESLYVQRERVLSVRNIEFFNISLLFKWKWRIFHDKKAIWTGILNHMHQNPEISLLSSGVGRERNRDSIWWRDLTNIGG